MFPSVQAHLLLVAHELNGRMDVVRPARTNLLGYIHGQIYLFPQLSPFKFEKSLHCAICCFLAPVLLSILWQREAEGQRSMDSRGLLSLYSTKMNRVLARFLCSMEKSGVRVFMHRSYFDFTSCC